MLLLLPFDRELDWSRPPLAVLGLILANCIVFFFLQSGDDRREAAALKVYDQSGLAAIELPAYRQWLTARDKIAERESLDEHIDFDRQGHITRYDPGLPYYLEFDTDFQQAVANRTLVALDAPEFARWQSARDRFEAALAQSYTFHYSLRPALATPVTMVSHMFLHAGFMHLFGNMLFLFVVGFVVEAVLGSGPFLLVYFTAGLASAGLDLQLHPQDYILNLGASGAIAGIMGGYAVLFGLRKIHFFYNILFWFDRIKAPAIIMLPLWLANEALQLSNNGAHSGVNYWAHIGGLSAGALLVGMLRLFTRQVDIDYMDRPEQEAAAAGELEQALDLIAAMQYERARPLLRRLLRSRPEDLQLWRYLFTASRTVPESEDFHDSARQLLLGRDTPPPLRQQIFSEYLQGDSARPRLNRSELLEIATHLLREGALELAERLVIAILKKQPAHPGLAPLLRQLARAPTPRAEQYRRALLRFTEPSAP